jgi:hypothetical protein
MEQPLHGLPLILSSIDEVIRDLRARGDPGYDEQIAILTKVRARLLAESTDAETKPG